MNRVFMEDITPFQVARMAAVCYGHRTWSDETFGPVGPVGPLKHLAEEAIEASEEPNNPTEYADCLFLMWDALARQNSFNVDDLLDAMEAKMLKNKSRDWPKPKDGQPRNHIS